MHSHVEPNRDDREESSGDEAEPQRLLFESPADQPGTSSLILVSGAFAALVAFFIRMLTGSGPIVRKDIQAAVALLWACLLITLRSLYPN
jgi:hypothetical protein